MLDVVGFFLTFHIYFDYLLYTLWGSLLDCLICRLDPTQQHSSHKQCVGLVQNFVSETTSLTEFLQIGTNNIYVALCKNSPFHLAGEKTWPPLKLQVLPHNSTDAAWWEGYLFPKSLKKQQKTKQNKDVFSYCT